MGSSAEQKLLFWPLVSKTKTKQTAKTLCVTFHQKDSVRPPISLRYVSSQLKITRLLSRFVVTLGADKRGKAKAPLTFQFTYLSLAALGLRCFTHRNSRVAASRGYSLAVGLRLLTAVVSLVTEHGLQLHGFSSWGVWA